MPALPLPLPVLPLSTAVCYTPQGTFYALSIGQSSTFTGLNLKHTYNSRLQPNEFSASSSAGHAIDISYNFIDPVTTHNAGHVYGITNNLDTTRSQTFTYDQLNRITGAQTTSTHATSAAHCWSEVYNVDPWANLQSIAATTNSAYTGCTQESGFAKTPDASNHLSGFTYDTSGNTTNDGVNAYTWNAESQMKTGAGVTYTYDGDGRRVQKSNGKLYWYGSGGEILAETDASGNTQNEYIFFGGQRIAMIPFSGTPPVAGNPLYYVEDLLGTSRVMTTNAGVVCYDADFYPYGGERTPYTNNCPATNNYKFEGKERDTETGNDDFGARYYSNRFGRWLSADWSAVPAPVPYANLTNPQTLNLYAMVADDPASFADLDGHCCPEWIPIVLSWITDYQIDQAIHEKNYANDPEYRRQYDQAQQDALIMAATLGTSMALDLAMMGGGDEAPPRGGVSEPPEVEPIGPRVPSEPGAEEPAPPPEPYNRRAHYGNTPTKADRQAIGGESVDHDPPLVQRYYEGDPSRGEPPGSTQTPAQRRASAADRSRMKPSTQGGRMSQYSKRMKPKPKPKPKPPVNTEDKPAGSQ